MSSNSQLLRSEIVLSISPMVVRRLDNLSPEWLISSELSLVSSPSFWEKSSFNGKLCQFPSASRQPKLGDQAQSWHDYAPTIISSASSSYPTCSFQQIALNISTIAKRPGGFKGGLVGAIHQSLSSNPPNLVHVSDAEGDTAGNIWRSIGMKPAAFPGGLSLTLEAKD